ncbi:MAG: MFS transporter [Woeseiaceae bacterium]
MPLRNLSILFLCQLISATGSIVIVTLGGIIGATLTERPALATLPISLMVVSVAATTVPASLLMRRIGRRKAFMLSSLSAAGALGVAATALATGSFVLFMIAAAAFGINMAFTQQYRYAAAESVPPQYTARAISMVLVGAIGGAVAGPELVTRGQLWLPAIPYGGSLLAAGLLYLVQALLFLLLGPLRGERAGAVETLPRPIGEITRQPVFVVAVFGGTIAYGVMTLIMTATPLSMHIKDGFSIEATSAIIRSHVLGMYLPSLMSGFLMDRLGTVRMMALGALGLMAASIVALQGHDYLHYWYALVLLGVGWNLLYVGGTTLLTVTYTMNERFKAQAVNEFAIFGTSASGSLLAGTVLHFYGWTTLVILPLLPLALVLAGLYGVRRNELLGKLSRHRS